MIRVIGNKFVIVKSFGSKENTKEKSLSCVESVQRLHVHSCTVSMLWQIYYSKFVKGQTFNFVSRRSCLSDTKTFMIDT